MLARIRCIGEGSGALSHRLAQKHPEGPFGDRRERPISDDPRNAGGQVHITKFECALMDPFYFTQGYFVFKASIFRA